MTSKLTLYNGALMVLGERPTTLTENRESRRVLDRIWDTGLRELALSAGLWNFATRTFQIEYTPDVEPSFGYTRAFEKPTDWVRTVALSADPYFNAPLNQYDDQAGYWFADIDTLYVKIVSKDEAYGYDLSLWPVNFARYAEALMALQGCERITQSGTKKKDVAVIMEDRLSRAKNTDAMNESAKFPPTGSWVTARVGRGVSTRTGGGRQF